MGLKRRVAVVGFGAAGAVALAGCNLGTGPVTYELLDDTGWGIGPEGLDSGDVDGDGDVDVVVAGRSGQGLVVLLNDGTGTFERKPGPVTAIGSHRTPSLADVDGDDDLDLLSSVEDFDSGQRVPGIVRNDGTGTFGAVEPVAPAPPPGEMTALVASDADGDGDVDLLAAFRVDHERHVGVYLNDGTGAFGAPATYPLGLASDRASRIWLVAGDLNGDGAVDVVATDDLEVEDPDGMRWQETHAMVALNDGTGAFTAAAGSPFRVGRVAMVYALSPALADFDEDGHLDLAVGRSTFLGDGAGGFGPALSSAASPRIDYLASADIDGDGHSDLVGFGDVLKPANATVAYGDGQGTIAASLRVDTGTTIGGDGSAARQIELADIDADGDPDVLFLAGTLGVLENVNGGRPPT